MKNRIFNQVSMRRPRSNTFDLSHERKMSMKMANLTPILCQEVIPGDKWSVNSEIFLRFAPLVAPIMHRVDVYTHFFFVPNRLVWDNWEKFITGGEKGEELETPTVSFPQLFFGSNTEAPLEGDLADYLGIPTVRVGESPVNANNGFNALPFRGYQLIFNEYYRDQVLSNPVPFSTGDDAQTDFTELKAMRKRAWQKDYLTSALPDAQKGGDVGIPVNFNYKDQSEVWATNEIELLNANLSQSGQVPGSPQTPGGLITDPSVQARIENLEEEGVTVPITDLRRAVRLQEWLEKNARAGSRYTESILAHFGVISKDQRLQRPEYLGGGKNPVTISEVLNTTGVITGTAPDQTGGVQGQMAGHGISIGNTNRFKRRFTEHGIIFGIMSVMPKSSYQDGLPRMFFKNDRFLYYWPEFAHIGEQAIENREAYLHWNTDTGISMAGTFGYTPRYAEYRHIPCSVHGDFRTNLEYWHMGRKFTTNPALNEDFITGDPTKRIFALTDPTEDELYVQIFNSIRARRPIPVFGDPRL